MSELRIFRDSQPQQPELACSDQAQISQSLAKIGVCFERWQANREIGPDDTQEQILEAYRDDIEKLKATGGYVTVDVINLTAEHPDKEALRSKFLSEHTHSEDEVRFFVAGQGLFSLHVGDKVYEVLCERGDLMSVPANTRHWFDMGPNPQLCVIRLFNNPEGWVARFTGSDIADRFSRLEN